MFQVGEHVEGMVVQIYCPGGISVDVGCSDTFAFLEVEARLGFSETSTLFSTLARRSSQMGFRGRGRSSTSPEIRFLREYFA